MILFLFYEESRWLYNLSYYKILNKAVMRYCSWQNGLSISKNSHVVIENAGI